MPSFIERLDDFLVRNIAYFNYKNYTKRLDLKGNERVLEVGCGGGNLSRFLAKGIKELICIDNSEYWIGKAKKRLKKFENIKFELLDVLEFNKKAYFDAVVISYVLHDINKEKREEAVKNIIESLKGGGKIYIREPTRKEHGISSNEIRSLMADTGFMEKYLSERYSFPLRGKVYGGVFQKDPR